MRALGLFILLIALISLYGGESAHDSKSNTSVPGSKFADKEFLYHNAFQPTSQSEKNTPAEWQIQTEHEACNLANILFGQRRIEISHEEGDLGPYETGIVLDNNPDSRTYNRKLGEISLPLLHGERVINDRDGPYCGTILKDNMTIYCKPCGRVVGYLKAGSENTFSVVTKGGEIVGSLEGRFPREALSEMGSVGADTAGAAPRCKDRIARLMQATGAKFERYSPGGENVIFTSSDYEDMHLHCANPNEVYVSTTLLAAYPSNEWFRLVSKAGEAVGSTSANEIEAAARKCHAAALNSAAENAIVRLPRARVECDASTRNGGGVSMKIWSAW